MIRFFCVALLFFQSVALFSQQQQQRDSLIPDTLRFDESVYRLKQSAVDSIRVLKNDTILSKLVDPLKHIENIGFRFIVRELNLNVSEEGQQLDPVNNAVNTLLQYVKNDSIRNMVFYLKEYIQNRKTEEALRSLKEQIELEKILSYQPNLQKPEEIETVDSWKVHALAKLYDYVEADPVHQWIREISRDSVMFGLKNYQNDSINFWINNGKQDFKRFWLKKNRRDSIGIWVQNAPNRSIRILVDDDVYQQSVQKSKMRGSRVKLEKKISTDQYKLAKLGKYKRYSQTWKLGAKAGFSFNQGHVSNSWARGGESSMATLSTFNAFANYKKGRHTWENKLDVKFGLLKSGKNGFRKNEDRIELSTKYGQKAVKNWYYSTLFNVKTQITKGYSYPSNAGRKLRSNFFSPAYVIASVGMDYKPSKKFSVLLSPLAAKYTIVRDTSNIDQTVFGVDKDEKVKKEAGAYVNIFHKTTFWENMGVENKLTFYSNYNKNPKNVDIDWELVVVMPINQYIATKFSTHIISDDDTGSKLQLKENLSVGVSYRF